MRGNDSGYPMEKSLLLLKQCINKSKLVAFISSAEGDPMKNYTCTLCGYVYDEEAGDPENGIAPGTKWEDLPDTWMCPMCGAGKEMFEED